MRSRPTYEARRGGPRPSALALVLTTQLVAACGTLPSSPQQYGPAPAYSRTSCFDNCGGDANCQMVCTNTAGPAVGAGVPGIMPGRPGGAPGTTSPGLSGR